MSDDGITDEMRRDRADADRELRESLDGGPAAGEAPIDYRPNQLEPPFHPKRTTR